MSDMAAGRESTAVSALAPAAHWRGWLIPMASGLGMLVSGYLTWIHWSGSKALCSGIGDCETVNSSPYAEIAGIPIALLGFGMYLVLLGLSMYGRRADSSVLSTISLAIFGVSLAGVLYSGYLTYIELAVLHAICPWCVISAVLITFIFVVSLQDMMRMTGES